MRQLAWVCVIASVASAAPLQRKVLAKGTRSVEIVNDLVIVRRGMNDVRALARTTGMTTTATIAPFLGTKKILDVTVSQDSSTGQHRDNLENHFLVDTSGDEDRVICTYPGNNYSAGEYASQSTTVTVTRIGRDPLSFDVKTVSSQTATQP
ncbi:MAG TPA: hypothetical protein VGC41_04515, partial [Kofleriaceae bacterium]